MKKICVFCGSRSGRKQIYQQKAEELADFLVQHNLTLVYGGAKSGLMGILADRVLSLGGQVIGVMPKILVKQEIVHHHLTQLHIVDSMQVRKMRMYQLADGFITLPGGTGTLDELSEILCLAQVGEHQKPIGLLNIEGYFQPWLQLFDHMVEQGFLKRESRDLLLYRSEPEELIQTLLKKAHREEKER